MPQVKQNNQKTITYSKEELQLLIHEDLMLRGLSRVTDRVISLSDTQKKTGDIPRGNFDSDPVYSFSGISVTIEESGE